MKIKQAYSKLQYLKYLKYLNKKDITKFLLRVKRILSKETKGNKVMIQTYYKMLHKEVTEKEIQEAHDQFKELLKTAGVGFLIVLPFSPLTFTALVKVGKIFKIDIIPKSFKEDEAENGEVNE